MRGDEGRGEGDGRRGKRALAWLGPEQAESALRTLKAKLPNAVLMELVMAAPQFPTWLARTVGKVAHG